MVLICFILDLRVLSPPLLHNLKQCFLQLANLYAVSRARGRGKVRVMEGEDEVPAPRDRMGLFYIDGNGECSSSPELKVAYRLGENFRLRDFHHSVNKLPMDCFIPEPVDSVTSCIRELNLLDLLSDDEFYTFDDLVKRRILLLTSSGYTLTASLQKSLLGAVDRCATVEFIMFEHEVNPCRSVFEKYREFIDCINDFENCAVQTYLPDPMVLAGLVKRWLQELINEAEDPLQANFIFKTPIVGSQNQIYCNLFASSTSLADGFVPCQTCRCHGYPLDVAVNKKRRTLCPLTCLSLETSDLIDSSVIVGEQTVLFLTSSDMCPKVQQISSLVTFDVIERTSLESLNEAVIIGKSYVVAPACHGLEAASEDSDREANILAFHALCKVLFDLDQGLVCSSTCNMETYSDGIFQCFYILQPSDGGPLLLRRLAGSEEIMPLPEMRRSHELAIPEAIKNSVKACLSMIEKRDYTPIRHERGLHPKLNWLVKESLPFGSNLLLQADKDSETKAAFGLPESSAPLKITPDHQSEVQEATSSKYSKEDMSSSGATVEWGDLFIVDGDSESSYTPPDILKHGFPPPPTTSSARSTKPLDQRTSRILERLGAPKPPPKPRAVSPSPSANPLKNPLVTPSSVISSQPLRPSFQRLKRKQY